MDDEGLQRWFLTSAERGNPSTLIDAGRGNRAWTEGNAVSVLVDGHEYFPALLRELDRMRAGDWLYLTDLQSDGNEQLDGPGSEIGAVLAKAAANGVRICGMLWRSHPVGHGAAEITNLQLSRTVNDAGGQLVLDHRVRRGGSHHQKMVVIRRAPERAEDDVAFVGGIDIAHGRNDGPPHPGDGQAINLGDDRYGARPPWHDVQVRLNGPAVEDVAVTFAERWRDPNPLEAPTPWRWLRRVLSRAPEPRGALAPARPLPTRGTHAVQVLRTYPARRRPYPFAVRGERSVARAYTKAFANARRFVYLEDQYLWSIDAARALAAALRREPELQCVIVIPRHPDPAGLLGEASRFGRGRVERLLYGAGKGRVAIYDLENDVGVPIYVHAKVCIVDDVWMTVGSDNLNRRSWTHDSELCCAIVDRDGELAGETRRRLAHEHLDDPTVSDADLEDPTAWSAALAASAARLDAWHANGEVGARPRGRLRRHPRDRTSLWMRPLLHALHALLLDPDGRPRDLRRTGRY